MDDIQEVQKPVEAPVPVDNKCPACGRDQVKSS
jgi:hypothetical protein